MPSPSLALDSLPEPRLVGRLGSRWRVRLPLVGAISAFTVVLAALLIAHQPVRLAVPRQLAVRHVLSDPSMAAILSGLHPARTDVAPLDARSEVVEFYRGSRLVASAIIEGKHTLVVRQPTDWVRRRYAYGSNIANDVRVLAALSAVFVLMTAVWPLRRIRNLDVLVMTSLTLSVVLFNRGQLTWMVLVTYPALGYLALRCAWWAMSGPSPHAPPSRPLYDLVTRRLTDCQRLRILRLGVLTAALVMVMVGLSSMGVIDVGYAVMEGATDLTHGILPYGHIPDVAHGDTYPLASYLLYLPWAWVSPVTSLWDSADATLDVAAAAALLMTAGVWWVVRRDARPARSTVVPSAAGLRAAIAFLTFPPLLVTVSTGTTDVVLALLLLITLVLWNRPAWATLALNAAVWFKLAPLAVFPLLLGRLRRATARYAWAALIGSSAAMLIVLVALGGLHAPERMVQAIGFQFTRSSPHTLWTLVGSVPLQQVAEAATIAGIVGLLIWLRRHPEPGEDRIRIAGLVAVVLIAVQVDANYWNYMYLAWVAPFIVISLLSDRGISHGASRSTWTTQLIGRDGRYAV